jgi:hypothetical protein
VSFFSVPRPAVIALLVSLGLHGVVGMWVKVRPSEVERPSRERPDVWSGSGIEIEPVAVDTEPAPAAPVAGDEATSVPETAEHTVTLEPACVNDCIAKTKKPPEEAEQNPSVKRTEPHATAAPSAAAPSASSTGVAPSASVASSASGAPGEAYGAVGLPPGVRSLPKAYVRALSEGSYGIAEFRSAPVGRLCEARLAVHVGEDSRLGELEYESDEKRDALPRACQRMFDNVMLRLRAGEFSVDPSKLTSGVMRIHVAVEVSDEEPHLDADRDPKGLWGESHEEPRAGKRGRSTFILNSGRRVDAFVDLE